MKRRRECDYGQTVPAAVSALRLQSRNEALEAEVKRLREILGNDTLLTAPRCA